MTELLTVPIEKVKGGKYEIRVGVYDQELEALAKSISRVGLINPILVVAEGDEFCLVAGHRRVAACKLLGRREIEACVQEASEYHPEESALAENLFRRDLSPMELAAAVCDLLGDETMTEADICAIVHHGPAWLNLQRDIMEWPEDVQQVLHGGLLSVSAAKNLAAITNGDYRRILVQMACDNGATARTTSAWLQAWRAQLPAEQAVHEPPISGSDLPPVIMPMSPCVICETPYRSDAIALLPICPPCIDVVRGIRAGGTGG